MINIGKINTLKVPKQQGAALYLEDSASRKILLLDKKLPASCQPGDSLDVFVYVDSEGHPVATAQLPLAQVDEIAWLKVVSINYYGAFLDWGLAKNLLLPFGEQLGEMAVGEAHLVRLFLDDKERVAATAKIDKFVADEVADADEFHSGQQVSLLIADKTELGFKAIVNNSYWGLLYQNELFQPLEKGQKRIGYIKQIREDKKIDLTLNQPGYEKIDPLAEQILAKLKANGGVLQISDKSPPEAIYGTFGVSKKAFKQAIGALYKQQLISIEKNAIHLA
ncbi:MAG: S1-like domain-containing RNA-binding protein [Methylovulum sp.]|nr:S1-like domain-containing RNA-binding protein [Methylovulum sp.]